MTTPCACIAASSAFPAPASACSRRRRLGADVVMLDLEDAVAPDDKPRARENDRRSASWTGAGAP